MAAQLTRKRPNAQDTTSDAVSISSDGSSRMSNRGLAGRSRLLNGRLGQATSPSSPPLTPIASKKSRTGSSLHQSSMQSSSAIDQSSPTSQDSDDVEMEPVNVPNESVQDDSSVYMTSTPPSPEAVSVLTPSKKRKRNGSNETSTKTTSKAASSPSTADPSSSSKKKTDRSVFNAIDSHKMKDAYSVQENLDALRQYALEHDDDSEQDNDESSDDEHDWEQVNVPSDRNNTTGVPDAPLEITIEKGKGVQYPERKGKIDKRLLELRRHYRELCVDLHLTHILCHLGVGCIRNRWTNDTLLQALLLSRSPWEIIERFRITETEPRAKSRALTAALKHLVQWWSVDAFHVIGPGVEKRNFWDVHEKGIDESQPGIKEPIDGPEDLADMITSTPMHRPFRGSRDLSALLFAALCKALGLPTRLVFSLQPIAWNTSLTSKREQKAHEVLNAPSRETTPQSPTRESTISISSTTGETKSIASDTMAPIMLEGETGKQRKSKRKASRQEKSTPNSKGEKPKATPNSKAKSKVKSKQTVSPVVSKAPSYIAYDHEAPPVFWVEVYSRIDTRWWPLDPVRGKVKPRRSMEPPEKARNNMMTHVIAWEEDGYIRDVTRRYASHYGAKTMRLRIPKVHTAGFDWWARTLSILERPYHLNRNDVEDAELLSASVSEQLPGSIALYKNHPLYALERHLRREEIIHPMQEIGRIKGEVVYPRSNVITLKPSEAWMKEGRRIKAGEQPMKQVKARLMTINKQRAMQSAREKAEQAALEEGGEYDPDSLEPQTGLYAEWQTEVYVPPPVENGHVPKNAYGNLDLFVPTMLPPGGSHLPHKGIAKIARRLGVDFAEAVTGFEFKKRRAIPVIEGIVVAQENAEMVLDAFWEHEKDRVARADTKREEAVLKRWKKLLIGLRTRHRLRSDYMRGNGEVFDEEDEVNELRQVDDRPSTAGSFLPGEPIGEGGFIPEGPVGEGGFIPEGPVGEGGFLPEDSAMDVDVAPQPKSITSLARLAAQEEERKARQLQASMEYGDVEDDSDVEIGIADENDSQSQTVFRAASRASSSKVARPPPPPKGARGKRTAKRRKTIAREYEDEDVVMTDSPTPPHPSTVPPNAVTRRSARVRAKQEDAEVKPIGTMSEEYHRAGYPDMSDFEDEDQEAMMREEDAAEEVESEWEGDE